MLEALKFHAGSWLTGGAHLLLLGIAAQADSRFVWMVCLAGMSAVSFFAWIGNYRRYRHISDLPTSRVAAAAQGYVELYGRSENIPGTPVVSKLTALPCCWYRYSVERKSDDDKWGHVDSGVSNEHFLLVDDTGRCVVSPEGAEVVSSRKHTWTHGDYRYTEWLLLPQGRLYALGEFATVGGANAVLDERADLQVLLADWKKDQARLLERFDLNRDGTVDLREWELARLAARREVQKQHREIRLQDGVHLLRRPQDGRLFLLANELPEKLGRRFAVWASIHVAIFLGAGAAALALT